MKTIAIYLGIIIAFIPISCSNNSVEDPVENPVNCNIAKYCTFKLPQGLNEVNILGYIYLYKSHHIDVYHDVTSTAIGTVSFAEFCGTGIDSGSIHKNDTGYEKEMAQGWFERYINHHK